MAAFNYNISITGDCSQSGNGQIILYLTGGTPPYTVEWVTPNLGVDGLIDNNQPSIRSSLSSGTYLVRVNDSTLPVNSEFYINIPVSDGVCASIVSVKNTTCNLNNGSVTGTSNSDYSSTNFYLYDNSDIFIKSATTNTSFVVFDSLPSGIYYLVVYDLGGCTGKTSNFIIEDSNDFDFELYVIPNSSCGGNPIGKIYVTGLTGNSPYTYQWSTGAITDYISGLTAGNYSVAVTDANGCTKTKSGVVSNVSPVGFGTFTSTVPSCLLNNGSLTLTITGGTAPFYYSASTGYVQISYSRNFTLNSLSPGPYSISVTDAGLCSFVASTILQTPISFTSVEITGKNSTCSSSNGSITINVIGGIPPYTYTLVGPGGTTSSVTKSDINQTFSNLSAGTYTAFVEFTPDPTEPSITCSYSDEITIITQNKFTISTIVTPPTCGNNNGIVTVTASSGGVLPYLYSIDGVNDIDGIFTNVSPGPHLIVVKDSSGCEQRVNVNVPTSVGIDFSLYSTSCGTGNNGSIAAFIGSGTPPFTFNWSNNIPLNPQEIKVTGLTAGTYSVTIVDSNSCSKTRSISINCFNNLVSYQSYVMCSKIFTIQSPTKRGLIQMLNEGFYDLTENNNSCNLLGATYFVKYTVNPLNLTGQTQLAFTSTTLNQAPSDNLYYDAVKSLLLTIPGVGNVTVNSLNNQITIQTAPGNYSLTGQEIIVELIIVYDIICLE